MPEKKTMEKARAAKRAGKSPTTQAGEFVHEEIEHVREGKHGARSAKQAIAIGLSKARRAGIKLPPPPRSAKASTKRSAKAASRAGRRRTRPSAKRARAIMPRAEARAEEHGVDEGAVAAGQVRGAAAQRHAPAAQHHHGLTW